MEDVKRALLLAAASGQIERFSRELPARFLWGFIGWLLGILTAVYLVSI